MKMVDVKTDLIENAREYFKNAREAENRGEYNSSVTLFFKAISALADICILENEGRFPSSHSERFRILELRYKKIYFILDKDFPFYQDSYRIKLNKEVSEMFKNDAEKLFEILRISV